MCRLTFMLCNGVAYQESLCYWTEASQTPMWVKQTTSILPEKTD
ncbi:MAG: hypothetical protein PUQ00_10215 [Nostoc sp. S13]|nr:hypothetical protein [Nostoc sp. S13]